jgi:hypothetical protein
MAESTWTRRDALRSLPFWSVSGPFALALVAQVAFIVHQIAFMEPIVGRAQAAVSVSLMTTFAVIGRLTLGAVVDRLDPRLISSVSMFSQAVALFVMTRTTDPTVLLVCCAAYGFSVGNIITLPALIVQREFPSSAFGMVLGLSTAIGTFAGALGPGLIGLILRDGAAGLHGAEARGRRLRADPKTLIQSYLFCSIPHECAAFIKVLPQSGRHILPIPIPRTGSIGCLLLPLSSCPWRSNPAARSSPR